MFKFLIVSLAISISITSLAAQPMANPTYGSPQQSAAPVDSSQQIADRIVASKIPVFIDFWAEWCKPCKLLDPIFKELEKKYKGKVLFMKVNVDINRALASYFKIQAIPAIYIVKDKNVINALTGLQPREAYEEAIEKALVKQVPQTIDSASAKSAAK
jgi:thioredoxin 1